MTAAKKEKKNSLSCIFLLNNYKYILSALSESEIWEFVPAKVEIQNSLEQGITEYRNNYKNSWSFLSALNQDEKLQTISTEKKLSSKEKKTIKEKFQVNTNV